MFLCAQVTNTMSDITSLGAAGVMGAMWLWERLQSRKRDEQLDNAHEKIMSQGVLIGELVDVVKANTEAMVKNADAMRQLADRMAGEGRYTNRTKNP
jgi:uncharacterized coiled-coil protein SlyX